MNFHKQARVASAVLLAVAALSLGTSATAAEPKALTGAKALTAAQLKAQDKVRVIVSFRAGAGPAGRSAAAAAGARTVVDLAEANAVAVEIPRKALSLLQRSKHVESVEEDVTRHLFATPAKRSSATPMVASGPQTVPYGISMVQADQLPDASASNRKLCIIDSGIDASHEDLAGIPMDGVNYSGSGEWYTDEDAHGTHVAGTIAAVNNTVGVVGVLPNKQINLYIAKVFDASGSAESSVIAQAVLACMRAKANVVSMSLGGGSPTFVERRIYKMATERDMLVVAAAGNDGSDTVSFPAGYADVVSVAAIDSNKVVADFSQFNKDVELSGPGVDVLSTVPLGSQTGASLAVGTASFSVLPMAGSPRTSATGVLADFGLGDTPVAGSMTGKVCLISRGTIAFGLKVQNCEASGGVGAVVYNNTTGDLNGTLGDSVTTIPSVGALQVDGATMLGQVGQSSTVAVFASTDNYAYFNGTSMATPHVSAVAALVWSYFPTCSATQIRASLDKSAQDLGDPGRDIYYGYGLVQAKATYDRIQSLGCGN